MKDKGKFTGSDKKLLGNLLSQPAIAKNKRSIQIASILALIVATIALLAELSQITGITISGLFDNTSVEDAIRVDYQNGCSSIVGPLNSVRDDRLIGVAFKDEEYKTVKEFWSKSPGNNLLVDSGILSLCIDSPLYVDVTGQSKSEDVKLAPFLVVRIMQISAHPENLKYNLIPGIGGASGSLHEVHAVLSPDQDEITAAIIKPAQDVLEMQGKSMPDFFTLSDGEHEAFQVNVSSQPGYTYSYQVGVYYSYKGIKHVKWIGKTFTSDGITKDMKMVNYDDLKVTNEIHLVDQTVIDEYNDKIREIRDIVRKELFFTLGEIDK